ncbi:MAG: hypothetical protein SGILL_010574 [Bacillariaceae sp.]
MKFTVPDFAKDAKAAMAQTSDVGEKQVLLKTLMEDTIQSNDKADIMKELDAAVPPGANLAEMIVFHDDDLTMLWGQIPPRFQSAVHNHTVFANILPLVGGERNVLFEEKDGKLEIIRDVTIEPGQVLQLAPDAIHCIENPTDAPARAFHCYGGDFTKLDEKRDLWTWGDEAKVAFSLPGVVKESIARMAAEENTQGLKATATAIPKVAPLVEKALEGMTAKQ